jgi:hypothetical protein
MPDSYRNFPEATAAPDAASVITAAQELSRLRTNNRPNRTTRNKFQRRTKAGISPQNPADSHEPKRAGKVFCQLKTCRVFAEAPAVLAVSAIRIGRMTMF